MSLEQVLRVLWRRKWIVLLTVLSCTVSTYVVTKSANKVYEATATLFVGDTKSAPDDFAALQSAQSLAKTYAELIQSRNVADRVATDHPGVGSGQELLDRVTFEPVSQTQLILLTAEAGSAKGAAVLANAYAKSLIQYADENLARQTKSDLTLADPARAPSSPTRPRPVLYTMVAFVLSLFLGVMLALLRHQLDGRLGDEEEVERELGTTVLASIPYVSRRRLTGDHEPFLEAFRLLRANLTFLRPTNRVRRILITSAEPGEGKTTTSVALARVIGEQGERVVVVEGDLRRPALSDALGVDESTEGLAQWLVLDTPFDQVVHPTPLENVYIVPAGTATPNPSTLLEAEALRHFLDVASEWADFVIVDSPPVSAGADASILAHAVRDVLFVVNQSKSRRQKVKAAIAQLRQAEADLAGVVVNAASGAGSAPYYGYGKRGTRQDDSVARELATSTSPPE